MRITFKGFIWVPIDLLVQSGPFSRTFSNCLVYPLEDIHQLRLSFPLPSVDEQWRIKPADYIRFIFAHEAPGSLNSYLKYK